MKIVFPREPKRKPTIRAGYQIRVTAFLDLMGFSDFVRQSSRNGDLVGILETLLTELKSFGVNSQDKKLGIGAWTTETTSFSDCIVISEHLPACDIRHFLERIGRFQRIMVYRKLPVRGAITVGKLLHQENLVFGPALVRAYELESRVAKYPRVIIDDSIIEAIMRHERAEEVLRTDEDQRHFVDFLSTEIESHFVLDFNMVEIGYRSIFEMHEKNKENHSVAPKLHWLGKYYFEHLSEHLRVHWQERWPDSADVQNL